MFAYCNNNPVVAFDPSGHFGLLSLLGAAIGGAIAGAVISTTSYIVSSALSGQDITGQGLLNAATVGAIGGAFGGAIGTIFLGSGAISATATVLAKGMASVGVGVFVGINTGIQTEGSATKRILTGFYTTLIATASTFGGSLIDASGYGFWESAFANFAATLFVATPAEIVAVAIQQDIAAYDYPTPAANSFTSSFGGALSKISAACIS